MNPELGIDMTDAIRRYAPPRQGLERDITVIEAEANNVCMTSFQEDGFDLWRVVTNDGYMLKYHQQDGMLIYVKSKKLHPVRQRTL